MSKVIPIDQKYNFEDGLIVSSTDLNGIITYANRKFCEIAGYDKNEHIGSNHNIIRHPDMPCAAFEDLWSTLHARKEWEGIVKNLRKDGRYYWVYTYITAIKEDDKTVEYSAARRPARQEELARAISYYRELLSKEDQNGFAQPLIDI